MNGTSFHHSGSDISVCIRQELDIAQARQAAQRLATHVGLSRSQAYRLMTTVSELGYNLFLHARPGGTVTLSVLSRTSGQAGIEVVAEDQGPGIADLDLALLDGYSTNHGLGGGLPGSRRLMDEFCIRSQVGEGTCVVARLWR
ncbi:anti-sigma regulatory factor [Pararhodospirillum photometricum]|uniref:Putative anti-sigma regulatory factor,serine/threonine protein kinase n=1 Tax=Pararhodospirillum photometricum DSM 122 TaxID=1150469 RepID=H6SPQ6_PARPM|nr:anti-sigma regulatory factor [Pararhodospirillum photometricum]CCG07176.1 Putative anti-sigma regulatory factor,serine/threonine protein kinase [Pararhodospirillum photometricum DSM 122]